MAGSEAVSGMQKAHVVLSVTWPITVVGGWGS